MHLNKRGVALLQVLIIAAVLAGMATMILRVVTSRTITARQNRKIVTAQMVIEGCMKEVAELWMDKTPQQYAEDLAACRFGDGSYIHSCHIPFPDRGKGDNTLHAQARFVKINPEDENVGPDEAGRCQLRYTIFFGQNWL